MAHYEDRAQTHESDGRCASVGDPAAFVAAAGRHGAIVRQHAAALIGGGPIADLDADAAVVLHDIALTLDETALALKIAETLDAPSC